jgi:hypothetical protein
VVAVLVSFKSRQTIVDELPRLEKINELLNPGNRTLAAAAGATTLCPGFVLKLKSGLVFGSRVTGSAGTGSGVGCAFGIFTLIRRDTAGETSGTGGAAAGTGDATSGDFSK